ncbi:MAG: FkbM family methyltransferase, partial [Acidimicrobiales bacterium]
QRSAALAPVDALVRLSPTPLRRWARRGLAGRDVRVRTGPAAGLVVNPGRSNPDYALGVNEVPVQEALLAALRPGLTVYDIGANIGFFTLLCARAVGSAGVVYSFEPAPDNAAVLVHNLAVNGLANAVLVGRAVSSSSGFSELWLAEYSGGHALELAGRPPDAAGQLRVETVSVDDFVAAGARPPDVVKIDVEGAETAVLAGMTRTLGEHRPVVLYEVDDGDAAALAAKRDAIDEILRGHDYTVRALPDSYGGSGWLVSHGLAEPVERR